MRPVKTQYAKHITKVMNIATASLPDAVKYMQASDANSIIAAATTSTPKFNIVFITFTCCFSMCI